MESHRCTCKCRDLDVERLVLMSLFMFVHMYMGGYQNYGPLLGPLNTRCRIILRTPQRDHSFDNHPHEDPSLLDWLALRDHDKWTQDSSSLSKIEG